MRLLCPWNFPGKNTGVGCHFLLQGHFSEKLCSISLKVTYLHKLFGIILQEYLSILSHLFIYINIMLYFLAQIIPALAMGMLSVDLCPFIGCAWVFSFTLSSSLPCIFQEHLLLSGTAGCSRFILYFLPQS